MNHEHTALGRGPSAILVAALAAIVLVFTPVSSSAQAQACADVTLTPADGGAALAAAVAAANLCDGPESIFLEPGTYVINNTLSVDDALAVVGTDPTNRSVIEYQPLNNNMTLRVFFVNTGAATFTAQNLRIPGSERIGMGSFRGSQSTFDNVHYSGGGASCSQSTPRGITVDAATATVTNSLFTNANCVGILGINGSSVSVADTEVTGTVGVGVNVVDGILTIERSIFHSNTTDGVWSRDSAMTMSDSEVYGNGRNGVQARGTAMITNSFVGIDLQAVQLVAAGNGGTGIFSPFAELTLTNTVIAHNGRGMELGTQAATVNRVTVRDNTEHGLFRGVSSEAAVMAFTDTVISNNAPDCFIAPNRVLTDVLNNEDSDGTCFPVPPCRDRVVTVNLNDSPPRCRPRAMM